MATVEKERLIKMDAVKEAKSEDGKATEEPEARTEAAKEEKSEVYAREEFQLASQTLQQYYEKKLNAKKAQQEEAAAKEDAGNNNDQPKKKKKKKKKKMSEVAVGSPADSESGPKIKRND